MVGEIKDGGSHNVDAGPTITFCLLGLRRPSAPLPCLLRTVSASSGLHSNPILSQFLGFWAGRRVEGRRGRSRECNAGAWEEFPGNDIDTAVAYQIR